MKIVCTSGCFDIIHGGHIKLLEEARKLGDILIVLVNDDAYLRRKGPRRPYLPLEERMAILRALRPVTVVLSFPDADPCRMLSLIEPDVFVKGSEYKGKGIVEEPVLAGWGGKVVFIDSGIKTHTGDIMQVVEADALRRGDG
jgi:D-beta-D-heptose 7-phosphate kinase/D-beta-D-heptose 1-phosphate adenosyltransferase